MWFLVFHLKWVHSDTKGHKKLSQTTKPTFFTVLKEKKFLGYDKRFNVSLTPFFTAIRFCMVVKVFYEVTCWAGPRTDLTKFFMKRKMEGKEGLILIGSFSWFSPYNHTSSSAVIMETIVVEHHMWIGKTLSRLITRNAKAGIAPKVIHIRLCPHFCHYDRIIIFWKCDKTNSANIP